MKYSPSRVALSIGTAAVVLGTTLVMSTQAASGKATASVSATKSSSVVASNSSRGATVDCQTEYIRGGQRVKVYPKDELPFTRMGRDKAPYLYVTVSKKTKKSTRFNWVVPQRTYQGWEIWADDVWSNFDGNGKEVIHGNFRSKKNLILFTQYNSDSVAIKINGYGNYKCHS